MEPETDGGRYEQGGVFGNKRFNGTAKDGGSRGCRQWQGAVSKAGYGVVNNRGGVKRVHRVMWELHKGPIEPRELLASWRNGLSLPQVSFLFCKVILSVKEKEPSSPVAQRREKEFSLFLFLRTPLPL